MKKFLLIAFIAALGWAQNASSQTRLGLHHTQEELDVWKQRAGITAGTTKYKVAGDVSTNSPGDWTRIVNNANAFKSNPSNDYYNNQYTSGGCIPKNYTGIYETRNAGDGIRDAAFYYLHTGDATYAAPVRTQLLKFARDPNMDFSNTSRYCPGALGNIAPGFSIAQLMQKLLFAYDYVKGYGSLTSGEKTELNTWFRNSAVYFISNYDPGINNRFVNRPAGNYTISSGYLSLEGTASDGALLYYGGPKARVTARAFNNRNLDMVSLVGEVGVFLNDATMIASAKRYIKDMFAFAVYPSGAYVDMLRMTETDPDHGYGYSHLIGGWSFMDALARIGDTELLDMETTRGTTSVVSGVDFTTDGTTKKGPKMHIKFMQDLRNHTIAKYGTSNSANVGNVKWQIDGVDRDMSTGSITKQSVEDVAYALVSNYYFIKDGTTSIRDGYRRTAAGAIAYPSSSQLKPFGPALGWTMGLYPGILFSYGNMEGVVNPYPTLQTIPPTKKDQTITFNALPEKTFGDASFGLTATAGSGLTVTYTSSNTAVVTISGSTATIVGAGTATITASQAGNGTFNPAPDKTQLLTVNKASQTITFPVIADHIITGGKFRLPTSTSTSGGTVTFAVTSGPAYISNGDTLNPTGVGVVVVTASQAGSTNYLPAQPVSRTFSFTPSAPASVTNAIAAITAIDSTQTVYPSTGQQQTKYLRYFVMPSPLSSYTVEKLTLPSGYGVPQNTLEKVELWVSSNGVDRTLVNTFDATSLPSFEAPVSYTGTIKQFILISYGKSIPARVPAGASGIQIMGH